MSKQKTGLVPELRFPEFLNEGEWSTKALGKCLDYIQPTKYLVRSTAYDDKYKTPVLTAGKTFILGYTDEIDGIFDDNLPVIIFDDFTTASKFVDFPFKAKSSAMKILIAKESTDIKFSYELLQLVRYKVGVHERHWISIFSKIEIPMPSLKEQQKIADCLTSIDELITLHTQKLNALKNHKKGLMQQLFPAEGETVPRLRFPEFRDRENWLRDDLGKLVDIIDGDRGSNYPKLEDFSQSGFCLFLNAKNVTKNGFRFENTQFISKDKDSVLRKGKLQRNDIVLTTRGTIGQFAYFSDDVPFEHLRINSGMVILRPKSKVLIPNYLYSFSKSCPLTSHIDNVAFGNAQQQLTVAGIRKFPISYPQSDEQQIISGFLFSFDVLIAAQNKKIEFLKDHKKGLMQKLFPIMDDVE
ncbi:restriction endonuclease subunit S [Xenorhabdus sp. XENO-1]|uniref:restriction endonuclease subunit S n=1 Tax=Xenorhabdus bovienii TaxID=40576 RepID=UPI0020CA957C|nr:restriction endonuclease subunit S [Xenorhabdus bovienii]MCP9269348.1 restriction endonuclease subunit S [Xenorhabdus bovienii subsp. africana]